MRSNDPLVSTAVNTAFLSRLWVKYQVEAAAMIKHELLGDPVCLRAANADKAGTRVPHLVFTRIYFTLDPDSSKGCEDVNESKSVVQGKSRSFVGISCWKGRDDDRGALPSMRQDPLECPLRIAPSSKIIDFDDTDSNEA
jgi:hypothetical protein